MSMTSTGAVIGTPYYLSPEQARGQRDIDARSDLYTAGVIMFEAVAGEVPVRANTFNELLFKIALEPPPPLTRDAPNVDPTFSTLVEKAMATDREARFQTAPDLAQALERWLATAGHSPAAKAPEPALHVTGAKVTAEGTPTSSSFGRTATTLGTRRRFPRALLVAAALGLLAAVGMAARLLSTRSSTLAGVPSSAPGVPSYEVRVSQVPIPVVLPVEPPAVTAVPTTVTAPVDSPPTPPSPALTRATGGAQRTASPRPVSNAPGPAATPDAPAPNPPAASPPTPTPPAPSPASPPPTPAGRQRRDFGY